MVCSLGGSGKSALINHLLQLQDGEKWAEEGILCESLVTKFVWGYEKSTKHGIKLLLFDTPGFRVLNLTTDQIITKMKEETNE